MPKPMLDMKYTPCSHALAQAHFVINLRYFATLKYAQLISAVLSSDINILIYI